jgi:hypothetical protein
VAVQEILGIDCSGDCSWDYGVRRAAEAGDYGSDSSWRSRQAMSDCRWRSRRAPAAGDRGGAGVGGLGGG